MILTHQQRLLERRVHQKYDYACDNHTWEYATALTIRYLKSWKSRYGHIGTNGNFADLLIEALTIPL